MVIRLWPIRSRRNSRRGHLLRQALQDFAQAEGFSHRHPRRPSVRSSVFVASRRRRAVLDRGGPLNRSCSWSSTSSLSCSTAIHRHSCPLGHSLLGDGCGRRRAVGLACGGCCGCMNRDDAGRFMPADLPRVRAKGTTMVPGPLSATGRASLWGQAPLEGPLPVSDTGRRRKRGSLLSGHKGHRRRCWGGGTQPRPCAYADLPRCGRGSRARGRWVTGRLCTIYIIG